MHGTTMVVIIVFISVGFSVIGAMHKRHMAFKEKSLKKLAQSEESQNLQEQLTTLKERVQVLEKIVTDEGYNLQKEISKL